MEYRSFADLSDTIAKNIYKIPDTVDLVVGIPRSGLLAGNLIALSLNLPIIDLDSFINNRTSALCRCPNSEPLLFSPQDAKHVLVVDDTILSGKSMRHAMQMIENAPISQKVTFCTVYAEPRSIKKCDICLEVLSSPRAFEWNIMHNGKIGEFSLEIDGVLCIEPNNKDMSDEKAYRNYILNTKPLLLPSLKVGYLITGRLEKYRKETEAWLDTHNIEYQELHMLDEPEIQRQTSHRKAIFKADTFKKYKNSRLFIDSDNQHAELIANVSGKPALCVSDQKLHTPEMSVALVNEKIRTCQSWASFQMSRINRKLLQLLGSEIGNKPGYNQS